MNGGAAETPPRRSRLGGLMRRATPPVAEGQPSSQAVPGIPPSRTFGKAGRPAQRGHWWTGILRAHSWLVALGVTVVIVLGMKVDLFQPIELFAEYPKLWIRPTSGASPIADGIVTILIDERSVAKLGAWGKPWRVHHGQLLERLAQDGARAVGFDVYFNQPAPEYDPALLSAVRSALARGTRVVTGRLYDEAQRHFVDTIPELAAAGALAGSTHLHKDRVTNLVRYTPLFQEDRREDQPTATLVPGLAVALAIAGGARIEELPRFLGDVLPIDFGGPSEFRAVSYLDAYEGRLPSGVFRDRYVLVGASFAASRDFLDTPTESQTPGVLVHARALYTVLRGLARPLNWAWQIVMTLTLALAALVVCERCPRWIGLPILGFVIAGFWTFAIALGSRNQPLRVDVVPGTATVILVWLVVAALEKRRSRRGLEASLGRIHILESVKSSLAKFVPRIVQDLIEQSPEAPALDKRETDVSVLFVDITGYTRLSAEMEPEQINRLVERYFGAFLDEILRCGGDVNETAGDGLMVIFQDNDPARHARSAVLAAIGIARRTRELNEELRDTSQPIVMHVGINSGVASVGATRIEGMAGTRWTYTASGPTTNIAARLAALSHDGALVISEETRRRIGDEFQAEDMGPQSLKNVATPMRTFRIFGEVPELLLAPETGTHARLAAKPKVT